MAALTRMNVYICASVLLVLAAVLLDGLRGVNARLRQPMAYRHQLRLGQALASAALLLPLVSSFAGRASFLPQTAQVWSAPATADGAVQALTDGCVLVSFGSTGARIPLDIARPALAIVFAAGVLLVMARLLADAIATLRVIGDAHTIREHGAARILASDGICVPFSFWLPGRCYVVVPSSLVLRGEDLRLAIRHELGHHRQQDTKLVYLYQLLQAAFFWNPAVYRLVRRLRELSEFSCDEALGGQRGVSARTYCQCLLRVAEAALLKPRAQIHASMLGGGAGKLLERRVEALLRRPTAYLRGSVVYSAGAVALALMAMTALAFASTIQDRRISASDASRMAAVAQRDSTFPIAVNDSVVTQLNLLLSTPDGRAHLQASLARMQDYEAFISEQLGRYGMPPELLAVPLVESGYRNLQQDADPWHGAGLWMFIAPTARRFDLTVDVDRDERLDVAAETGAAVRVFSSLHRQFNDWGLALLAFNAGGARVERAITETGSRDVWTLIARGHENDAGYVPRVMAAILILQNPSVLD